jgi:hypothetical protein
VAVVNGNLVALWVEEWLLSSDMGLIPRSRCLPLTPAAAAP